MSSKIIISTIVILLVSIGLRSQVSFGEQQIISTTDSLGAIHSSDLDGDGDLDIISGGGDNQIYALNWYENIDSQGSFEKHIIAEWGNNQTLFNSLRAADLDGDGDLDIVGVTSNDLYWFENLNGEGNFGEPIYVGSVPAGLCIADIDNDDDLDIITGKNVAGREGLVWYENIDGLGDFGPEQVIFDEFIGSANRIEIDCFDLDEDDDIDILYSSEFKNEIIWFPNLGSGSFDLPQTITDISGEIPVALKLYDIDGDNDLDIICFSGTSPPSSNSTIFWCENIDNSSDFGSKQIIYQGPDPLSGFPADLDSDGDIDIVLMYNQQDGIYWFENIDGLGDFGTIQTISPNGPAALSIYATDIDGDNDPDLFTRSFLSLSYYVSWYENTSILSVNANNQLNFSVHPIPVSEILHIESTSNIQQLRIFNSLGQMVQQEIEQNSINLSQLSPGLFIIEIVDADGRIEFKKIIKK